jgi:adenosylmethionine-8-amino-7-oxononanoate aminotransferase
MHKFIPPDNLKNWQQRDLSVLWHPCTQMSEHPDTLPLIPIKSAQGVWLEDINGKRYLDAISSWWTNLFGHSEPRIAHAIAEQALKLEHVIFAGFSHEPGLQLAEQLVKLSPSGLNRVFYADNGSAAVEVALKMSFQFFANQGQTKKQRFIALSNSYHGETLGALSMADVPLYRQVYAPLLLTPLFTPAPDHLERLEHESEIQCAIRCAEQLEKLVEQHHHEVCAMIVEPLVQCAGGMRMYHPIYLEHVRRICNQYGIHLIADEIAVGFGRTGSFFACEQANISPDFLCLSKGLTGGFLPMSAVLTTDDIFNGFLSSERSRGFLHSHSYTGNPLGCAAALASLAIFHDDNIIEKNITNASLIQQHMRTIKAHPNVANLRQTGMIAAFDLVRTNNEPFPDEHRRGLKAYRAGLELGAVIRPLGDTLYWMPPYCIQPDELQFLADTTLKAIDEACS